MSKTFVTFAEHSASLGTKTAINIKLIEEQ
jgi:hypothetical protein